MAASGVRLCGPVDPSLGVLDDRDASLRQVTDKARMHRRHDPVMIATKARQANHHVPSLDGLSVVDAWTHLEWALAHETIVHDPVGLHAQLQSIRAKCPTDSPVAASVSKW